MSRSRKYDSDAVYHAEAASGWSREREELSGCMLRLGAYIYPYVKGTLDRCAKSIRWFAVFHG